VFEALELVFVHFVDVIQGHFVALAELQQFLRYLQCHLLELYVLQVLIEEVGDAL
jgi:hypothetical protein